MMKHLNSHKDEFRLNEILFENRNKDYGAYVLRNEYDKVLTKSMFIGIAFFVVTALTPLIISSMQKVEVVPADPTLPPEWILPPEIEKKIEPEPPAVVPQRPEPVKTIDTRVPTPAKNPAIEKPAVPVTKYDDAVAGTQDIEGVKPTVSYSPPAVQGPVVEAPKPAPAPVVDDKAIATSVDVQAVFAGGIDAFRNRVVNNFDTSGFEGSGDLMKTTVTFVVERDGTISNIKANGPDAAFNREAERTIRGVKGKWTPGKIKGNAVRSYFNFPISMRFE